MKIDYKNTRESIEGSLEWAKERYEKGMKLIILLEKEFGDIEFPDDPIPSFNFQGSYKSFIVLHNTDAKGVAKYRKGLVKLFKGYTDKLEYISVAYGTIVQVKYVTNQLFDLIVTMDMTEVPQSWLPSKSCKFEEVTKTSYNLSCPVKE